MKRDDSSSELGSTRSRALWILWTALGLALLTFCGGKTDDGSTGGMAGDRRDGGSSSGGMSGGSGSGGSTTGTTVGGFGGHTGGCLGQCGGPCPPCTGGSGGFAGLGGVAGSGGFAGSGAGLGGLGGSFAGNGLGGAGFGGHTAGCIGQCGGICPPCPGPGDASAEAGDAAISDASVAQQSAATPAAQTMVPPGCYALTGYEPDPCLPADDSLLSWLSDLPTGCTPHVTAGPVAATDGHERTCCYSVTCDAPGTRAPDESP